MNTLIITLVVLAVLLWAIGAFQRANTGVLAKQVQYGGGLAALGIAGILAFRGNLAFAFPLGTFGLWLLTGGKGLSVFSRRAEPPSSQASTVRTDHLEMQLDHATGAMRGRVLKGFFAGRELDHLKPVELAHLWQDCRFADPQSAQLIETYLDRRHPTWREDLARAEADHPKGPDGRMARPEALDILGLKDGATPDEIRDAHKKLMLRLHPDRGGSNYLAAKINEAKAVALGD